MSREEIYLRLLDVFQVIQLTLTAIVYHDLRQGVSRQWGLVYPVDLIKVDITFS